MEKSFDLNRSEFLSFIWLSEKYKNINILKKLKAVDR